MMQLLEEFVAARLNMSDAEREVRERELLRRMRERAVVARWIDGVRARRTVRAARAAAVRADRAAARPAGETAEAAGGAAAAAPARDLADAAR